MKQSENTCLSADCRNLNLFAVLALHLMTFLLLVVLLPFCSLFLLFDAYINWAALSIAEVVIYVLQLPLLCGLPFLEKRASQTAHLVVGRSGKHLFLTDSDEGKPPLLLRMVDDSDDLKFMLVLIFLFPIIIALMLILNNCKLGNIFLINLYRSALCAFKRRVAYANANYDRILFWG